MPSQKEETENLAGLLEFLGEDAAPFLASFVGESRSAIESRIQLLPLGSKLALEALGIIELREEAGQEYLRVEARPLLLELAKRAAH